MRSWPSSTIVWLTSALIVAATAGRSSAGTIIEQFNGVFSENWNAQAGAFPSEYLWAPGNAGDFGWVTYSGNAPSGVFQQLGGAQVYRMTTVHSPMTRSAMFSEKVLQGTVGFAEIRFNTVTQDSQRIDQFVDLSFVNALDPAKYVRVGLFGSGYSSDRGWSLASSTDGARFFSGINYLNDTWYRARIDATANALVVSIWNDDRTVEYGSYTFSHTLSMLGSSFRVGVGQFMGSPGAVYINDVAVDSVVANVSPQVVPTPTAAFGGLFLLGGIGLWKRLSAGRRCS